MKPHFYRKCNTCVSSPSFRLQEQSLLLIERLNCAGTVQKFRCYEVKIEESEKAGSQLDDHQPSQSSICTAQVGLKWLSCTPGLWGLVVVWLSQHSGRALAAHQVSWVRFPALYFRLIMCKFLFIPTWGKSSKQYSAFPTLQSHTSMKTSTSSTTQSLYYTQIYYI